MRHHLAILLFMLAACTEETSARGGRDGGGPGPTDTSGDASLTGDTGTVEDTGTVDTGSEDTGTVEAELCDDGADNDLDGRADCDDADCLDSPACVPDPEICDDGVDNDLDGDVDCVDRECVRTVACAPPFEFCDDGVDNDLDGFADCADPDCDGVGGCALGACTNSADLATLSALDFNTASSTCASGCISGGGAPCFADCIETNYGISAGCSDCFGGVFSCTIASCLFNCISPSSPACQTCLATNCGAGFTECAGIPLSF